jgi:hypothetical protein
MKQASHGRIDILLMRISTPSADSGHAVSVVEQVAEQNTHRHVGPVTSCVRQSGVLDCKLWHFSKY